MSRKGRRGRSAICSVLPHCVLSKTAQQLSKIDQCDSPRRLLSPDQSFALGALISSLHALRISSFMSCDATRQTYVADKHKQIYLEVFDANTDAEKPGVLLRVRMHPLLNERLDAAQARRRLSAYNSSVRSTDE